MAASFFNEAKTSFIEALGKYLRNGPETSDSINYSALINEILYLSPEDIKVFHEELNTLLGKYTAYSPDKRPYSMFLSVSETRKT